MRMRTHAIILSMGSGIILSWIALHVPDFSEAASTPEMAADEGLAQLPELVTSDTAKGLGITSKSEASEAVIDKEFPLKAYTVELSALRKFKRGDDAEKLMKYRYIIIYPIKVDGTVRSSMTVSRLQDGTWDVTAWGAPGFIKELTDLEWSEQYTYLVVWIPELNLYFLGERQQDGKLMLASIKSRPELKLEKHVWKWAPDMYLQLSELVATVKPYKPSRSVNPREPE